MNKVIDNFRNSILRSIMSIPRLLWFLLHFLNHRFMCSVVGIIRDSQNHILLLEHRYRPNSLALPAGWLKKGETPFDAIIREVKEETNFEIILQRILNVIPSNRRSHLEFIIDESICIGSFISSDMIKNFFWLNPSEIDKLSLKMIH